MSMVSSSITHSLGRAVFICPIEKERSLAPSEVSDMLGLAFAVGKVFPPCENESDKKSSSSELSDS